MSFTIQKIRRKVSLVPMYLNKKKVTKPTLLNHFRTALDTQLPIFVKWTKEDSTLKMSVILEYKGSITNDKGLVTAYDMNIFFGITKHSNGDDSPFTRIPVRNIKEVGYNDMLYILK